MKPQFITGLQAAPFIVCVCVCVCVCLNVVQEEVALIKLSHSYSVPPVVLSTDFLFAGSI